MTRKRPGWRAAERTYQALTRDLKKKARDEQLENARSALRLCVAEIEQFHAKAYPKCDGGCPAHEALEAARAFLAR